MATGSVAERRVVYTSTDGPDWGVLAAPSSTYPQFNPLASVKSSGDFSRGCCMRDKGPINLATRPTRLGRAYRVLQ